MKNILAVVLTSSVCLGAPAGGVPQPSASGDRVAHPESLVRVVEGDAENKGSVPIGVMVARHITVLNTSHSSIKLSVETKSCACLDPKAEPEVIKPGEMSELTFGVTAAGASEPQRYTTVFRAAEMVDSGQRRVQDISAGLRYTASFDFLIKPMRLSTTAVTGQPIDLSLFLQTLEKDGIRPGSLSCSIRGLAVTGDEKPMIENGNAVWELRVRGRVPGVGFHEGHVSVSVEGKATGTVEVPLAVRVRPTWIASPPGIVMNVQDSHDSRTIHLKLAPRSQEGTASPAAVSIPPGLPGLSASLARESTGEPVLVVTLDPRVIAAPCVREIELIDKEGAVLCTVPIVLFRPTGGGNPPRRR